MVSLRKDVESLKRSPLPEVRSSIALKIASYFNDQVFDAYEKELAQEIIRLLAKDIEVTVRRTVAESLKLCSDLPHDVALKLAKDVEDEVAIPILECSQILSADDLVNIVKSSESMNRLHAVAKRHDVPEIVTTSIVETNHQDVIQSLLRNETARIAATTMQKVVSMFEENNLLSSLIEAGDLPLQIASKMVSFVSSSLKDQLIKTYRLSDSVISEAVRYGEEAVLLGITKPPLSNGLDIKTITKEKDHQKIHQFVLRLEQDNKLTYSIVLRALCEGNIVFFEAGLALLSNTPIANARRLVWDANPLAFRSLYERASMPSSALAAVEILLLFVKQEIDNHTIDIPGFKGRMVERIIQGGYDQSIPFMPYIVSLLSSGLTANDILST